MPVSTSRMSRTLSVTWRSERHVEKPSDGLGAIGEDQDVLAGQRRQRPYGVDPDATWPCARSARHELASDVGDAERRARPGTGAPFPRPERIERIENDRRSHVEGGVGERVGGRPE